MITWTWEIPIYLWLAGMAGGAYFVAFLTERFKIIGKEVGLLRAATWIGVPIVGVGSLLLIFEIGQPVRAWHLFVRFRVISPMSLGAWLLLIWAIIGALMLALGWLKRGERALNILSWSDFILAILLISYTGVLLSVNNQPLWSLTLLLPALFVASAVSTGVAALVVIVLVRESTPARTLAYLSRADVVICIIELVVLALLLVWLGPTGKVITTGTLGVFFWVGVVLIGILVPLGIGVRAMVRGQESSLALLLAALWVIAGGLVLRAVIVLGGQIYG